MLVYCYARFNRIGIYGTKYSIVWPCNSELLEQSQVLKGETVPAGATWAGLPAAPVPREMPRAEWSAGTADRFDVDNDDEELLLAPTADRVAGIV